MTGWLLCYVHGQPDGQLGNVKEKWFYSLFQYDKDKQDHAKLNICERTLKVVPHGRFRSTTNPERIIQTRDV